PVPVVLLVLQGGVVAPFADATGQGDDVFHSCLFGGEKEKSLGFLGAVNSSRGSRAPIDRTPGKGYKAIVPTARSPRRGEPCWGSSGFWPFSRSFRPLCGPVRRPSRRTQTGCSWSWETWPATSAARRLDRSCFISTPRSTSRPTPPKTESCGWKLTAGRLSRSPPGERVSCSTPAAPALSTSRMTAHYFRSSLGDRCSTSERTAAC